MKKTMVLIFVLLLIIPLTVNAEKVTSLETTVEGQTIKFTGTTEDGITAVACHLFNSDDEDLNQYSYPVDQNSFNGEFDVTEDGVYKVLCAKYEGGEITSEEVTVGDVEEEVTEDEETTEEVSKDTSKGNPVKTYDNIKTYVKIAAGALVLIAGALIFIKKKEIKNK